MKRRLIRKTGVAFAMLAMLFGGASCVKDGWEPCNNKLRIVYDYNMARTDLFHTEVAFLSIFVFDSGTGLLADEIRLTGPFGRDFEIEVPQSLYDAAYDYVVWAGLDAASYSFPTAQTGVTTLEDLRVQVNGYDERLVVRDLEPLWHGMITDVTFDIKSEQTKTISLMKDTKTFRIGFSFVKDGGVDFPYTRDDIEVGIHTASGWYSSANAVLDAPTRPIRYAPYYAATEEGGFVFEMNTLRLMADREATLVVRLKSKDRELMRMPLTSYLDMLRTVEHGWIKSLQEYLDREDEFRILLYFTDYDWTAFQIIINDWVVREQGVD